MTDEARFRHDLRAILNAALDAADPGRAMAAHIPTSPKGRTLIVGAGKASVAMAAALERGFAGPVEGLIVTPEHTGASLTHLRLIEASHPLPGLEAQAAAAETLVRAGMLTAADRMIVLLSGGGSALWPAPRRPLTLDAKRDVTRALLASGAPIAGFNAVRKHLSRIKGGWLARVCGPCEILALAISDVPGDDPAIIASGPVSPDPTTRSEALGVLAQYGIEAGPDVMAVLNDPACETPKPGDLCFERVDYRIVLRPADMLAETARQASALGYEPVLLGDALEGEAREVGAAHAALALSSRRDHPVALISGGELTVTIAGRGEGGPNREYALALAMALNGADGIAAMAADTDGIDGSADGAGALVLPSTLPRARAARLDAAGHLAANDSGGFFKGLGDAIITGPTGTNVNDVRVILIQPSS